MITWLADMARIIYGWVKKEGGLDGSHAGSLNFLSVEFYNLIQL
jgi:hypothetical protein